MTTMNDKPESFGETSKGDDGASHALEKKTAPASEGTHGEGAETAEVNEEPSAIEATKEKKARRAKLKAGKGPATKKAARGRAKAKVPREAKAAPVEKKPKAPKLPPFDLDALPPERREIVESGIATIQAIGRKTTRNVFDLGEAFDALATALPEPAHWRAAVTRHCGTSWKFADNWRKVHLALGARRDEIVQHQVTPTVLIHLIPASPEAVDEVLGSFAAGKPMKVREVKALVTSGREDDGEEAGSEAKGGARGLRNVGMAKLARQQRSVTAALKEIRQGLASAVKAAGAKRLEKGKLAKELMPIARVAHRELTEILCGVDPASLFGGVTLRHQPVEDERWASVLRLLARMSNAETWPEASELKAWIGGEAMRWLAFALDGADEVANDGGSESARASDVEPIDAAPDDANSRESEAVVTEARALDEMPVFETPATDVSEPSEAAPPLKAVRPRAIIPGLLPAALPKAASRPDAPSGPESRAG